MADRQQKLGLRIFGAAEFIVPDVDVSANSHVQPFIDMIVYDFSVGFSEEIRATKNRFVVLKIYFKLYVGTEANISFSCGKKMSSYSCYKFSNFSTCVSVSFLHRYFDKLGYSLNAIYVVSHRLDALELMHRIWGLEAK